MTLLSPIQTSEPECSTYGDGGGIGVARSEPPSLKEAAASSTFKLSLSSSQRGSFRRKPSMDEARRFEERRKPHRIADPSQPSGYRLARVGETEDDATGAPAEAYTMGTPLSGLDSFGIGISLYFRQVRAPSWVFIGSG